LCPSGTSRLAPAAATFTFEEITALPPPIAARIGLPSIGVDVRAAMLRLAVDANERALAVGHSGPVEELDEIGHQPPAEHGARLEQWSEIVTTVRRRD